MKSNLGNSINKQKERITPHLPKISSWTQAIKSIYTNYLRRVFCIEKTQNEVSPASELLCNWISLHVKWSPTSLPLYVSIPFNHIKILKALHTAPYPSVCSHLWGAQPTNRVRGIKEGTHTNYVARSLLWFAPACGRGMDLDNLPTQTSLWF